MKKQTFLWILGCLIAIPTAIALETINGGRGAIYIRQHFIASCCVGVAVICLAVVLTTKRPPRGKSQKARMVPPHIKREETR